MEIEYSLAEPDLVAFALFRVGKKRGLHNPILTRRIRYAAGFVLLGIGFGSMYQNALLTLVLLVLAVIAYIVYPSVFRWLVGRRIAKSFRDPKNAKMLEPRTLSATQDGLEEKYSFGDVSLKWDVIDDLAVTATHLFISVNGEPTIAIPKDRITQGSWLDFVHVCHQYMKQPTV